MKPLALPRRPQKVPARTRHALSKTLNERQKKDIRKGKGRAASQDLRDRKRLYEEELGQKRAANAAELLALDKREAAALGERRRLQSALAAARANRTTTTTMTTTTTTTRRSRTTVPAYRQPTLNGGVVSQSATQAKKKQDDLILPAVYDNFNPQWDRLYCSAGSLMVMMALMTTTSSGRIPAPGETLVEWEDSNTMMMLTSDSSKAWPSLSTMETSTAATQACTTTTSSVAQLLQQRLIAWRSVRTHRPPPQAAAATAAA